MRFSLAYLFCAVCIPLCFCCNSDKSANASPTQKAQKTKTAEPKKKKKKEQTEIKEGKLPEPSKGGIALNEALQKRRSERGFAKGDLTLQEISDLLWACQGVTSPYDQRTAPSAGALYPLEVHLITKEGLFHYNPQNHSIKKQLSGDLREDLAEAALGQSFIGAAAANIIISGVIERTAQKYGPRAGRYVAIESGAAAQNILLQATALNWGSVIVGAFDDKEVLELTAQGEEAVPFAIIAIGKKMSSKTI